MKALRRWLISLALAGAVAVAPTLAGAQGKIVWNFPHYAAPTYYIMQNYKEFAQRVQEKTGGRLEIRIHPGSSLYPMQETHLAVIDGRAEIGPVGPIIMTDVLIATGVVDLPFMTSSVEEHRKAAEGLRGFFVDELAKQGLMLLAVNTWPSQQLFSTKKPVRTVEDWKGLKVRIKGSEEASLTSALGGSPVSIPFGELYTALQRGVAEAAITSATNAIPMKFFEVTKYINYWHFTGAGLDLLTANRKAWDALPPDVRSAVTAVIGEMRLEDKQWADARAWDERAQKDARARGMTIVEVPMAEIEKARKFSRPVWDAWTKRAGAAGQRALQDVLRVLGR
jgi:TRAP-type C4-dicarboxylate transport system substrate-binding protein